MTEIKTIDLSSVIVSVASAVVEANRIMNEGSEAPMGISEFGIKYQVHASLEVKEQTRKAKGIAIGPGRVPLLEERQFKPVRLANYSTMTPKERILTGYLREADITISAKFEPLPRTT